MGQWDGRVCRRYIGGRGSWVICEVEGYAICGEPVHSYECIDGDLMHAHTSLKSMGMLR